MRIGELSRQTHCPVETIRYYEKAGLLAAPSRSNGNYRQYGAAHVERLQFIRHCRSLDMTHEEIRTLLSLWDAPETGCREVNALIDDHIGHVADRIDELKSLERKLKTLRKLCTRAQATKDCGIIRELARGGARGASKNRPGHVQGPHTGGN